MNNRTVIRIAFAVCLAAFPVQSQGGVIFEIVSGPSVDLSSAQNSAAGAAVTTYTRGFGLVSGPSSSTFNSEGFTVSGIEADAVANGDYITWGFTSATPYDMTDFDIRYDRSPTGPTGIRIDFQANGGAFQTVLSDLAVNANGETITATSLSSFGNVTSGTFRLIGFGATDSGGTFDFENTTGISSPGSSFQLNGTAAVAVPEPAFAAFLGTFLMAGAIGSKFRNPSKPQNGLMASNR